MGYLVDVYFYHGLMLLQKCEASVERYTHHSLIGLLIVHFRVGFQSLPACFILQIQIVSSISKENVGSTFQLQTSSSRFMKFQDLSSTFKLSIHCHHFIRSTCQRAVPSSVHDICL